MIRLGTIEALLTNPNEEQDSGFKKITISNLLELEEINTRLSEDGSYRRRFVRDLFPHIVVLFLLHICLSFFSFE